MKFAAAALFIGAVAAGGYGGNGTWGEVIVTDVVTSFTTYCPEATTFVHGESTYTVTEATTLTITNCPCTLTHTTSTWCPSSTPPPPPPPPVTTSAPYTWCNSTVTTSKKPTGTGSVTTSASAQFTGAASHLNAAGAGVAAVAGLVAALL